MYHHFPINRTFKREINRVERITKALISSSFLKWTANLAIFKIFWLPVLRQFFALEGLLLCLVELERRKASRFHSLIYCEDFNIEIINLKSSKGTEYASTFVDTSSCQKVDHEVSLYKLLNKVYFRAENCPQKKGDTRNHLLFKDGCCLNAGPEVEFDIPLDSFYTDNTKFLEQDPTKVDFNHITSNESLEMRTHLPEKTFLLGGTIREGNKNVMEVEDEKDLAFSRHKPTSKKREKNVSSFKDKASKLEFVGIERKKSLPSFKDKAPKLELVGIEWKYQSSESQKKKCKNVCQEKQHHKGSNADLNQGLKLKRAKKYPTPKLKVRGKSESFHGFSSSQKKRNMDNAYLRNILRKTLRYKEKPICSRICLISPDTCLHQSSSSSLRSILGNHLNFKERIPAVERSTVVYTLDRSSTSESNDEPNQSRPPDLSRLMNIEMFRLYSFSHSLFPSNTNVWVTLLASQGFHYNRERNQVCCLVCNTCYSVNEVPLQNGHRPDCQWREVNTPFNEGTRGVPEEWLNQFFVEYGSLNGPETIDRTEPRRDNAVTRNASGPTDSGYHGSLTDASGSFDESNLRNAVSSQGATAHPATIDELEVPPQGPQSLPHHQEGSFNSTDPDYVFNGPRSLPANLGNDSSRIIQETEQNVESGTPLVLTSAADSGPKPFVSHLTDTRESSDSGNIVEGATGGSTTLDLRSASYPQFASAQSRRETFINWSPDHPKRPEDLVAGGFFFAGYADCVRCFYCGLGLKYWRAADIIEYQHARFRPLCVYNRMFKGQAYIDRVQQDVVENQMTSSEQVNPLDSGPMLSDAAQQALREGWTRHQVRAGVEKVVSELGEDCLIWEILLDVLNTLHSENIAHQGVANQNRQQAREVARNVPRPIVGVPAQAIEVADNAEGARPARAAGAPAAQQPPNNPQNGDGIQVDPGYDSGADTLGDDVDEDDVAEAEAAAAADPEEGVNDRLGCLEQEQESLLNRTKCRICNERPISCIYLPCGHVVACQECAEAAQICIFCQQPVEATANVYLS